jgi:OmpA-OmpF porin, OOP family
VVEHLATAQLLGSYTVVSRVQIGARLPVVYLSGDGVETERTSSRFGRAKAGGSSATAVGDPMIEAKVRALGAPDAPVVLGAAVFGTIPLGHAMAEGKYVGDASPTVGLRGILDARLGRVSLGANAGVVFRKRAELGTLDLGPEVRYAAGAAYSVTPRARALLYGFSATNFSKAAGTNAAEAHLAFELSPSGSPVTVTAGGGPGLNQGFGAPSYRVFAGAIVAWERTAAAVEDPTDPDKDGILSAEDKCPREGGDVVHLAGPYYGCPKRDSDEDGVLDHVDACPTVPGVSSPDPAESGCPEKDRDHDGIVNEADKCPDQPETINGFEDTDGCPDALPPIIVEVRNDQIVVINEHINFEFNSDRIEGKRSFEALDLVAEAMKKHPEIRKVEVAGHTDDIGGREENMGFSRRRAATVMAYLVSKGVSADRLVSNGYGPDKPVADNRTPEGRAANRRVQFNIVVSAK